MISQTYPAVKSRETFKRYVPPAPPKQTQTVFPNQESRPNEVDKSRAKQFQISPEEFVRRDQIVRQLFLDTAMFYKAGDIVECRKEADREKYGKVSIRGVFKTFHDFPTAEAMVWPVDDIPYIFTVQPSKDGTPDLILCTADFFQPVKNK